VDFKEKQQVEEELEAELKELEGSLAALESNYMVESAFDMLF